jgi:excisionase family DNA binding protein
MTKVLFSDRDVAELLGCGRSTVWRWVADGVLARPIKVGGLTRWRREDIDAAVERAVREREAA